MEKKIRSDKILNELKEIIDTIDKQEEEEIYKKGYYGTIPINGYKGNTYLVKTWFGTVSPPETYYGAMWIDTSDDEDDKSDE